MPIAPEHRPRRKSHDGRQPPFGVDELQDRLVATQERILAPSSAVHDGRRLASEREHAATWLGNHICLARLFLNKACVDQRTKRRRGRLAVRHPFSDPAKHQRMRRIKHAARLRHATQQCSLLDCSVLLVAQLPRDAGKRESDGARVRGCGCPGAGTLEDGEGQLVGARNASEPSELVALWRGLPGSLVLAQEVIDAVARPVVGACGLGDRCVAQAGTCPVRTTERLGGRELGRRARGSR